MLSLKKNIILIIVLFLFITGCDATYNIEIYNDKVIEEFSIVENNSSIWDRPIRSTEDENSEDTGESKTYRQLVKEEVSRNTQVFVNQGDTYYKKELISTDNSLGLKYNYTYKVSEYKDAYLPKSCFKYFNFIEENQTYILSTSQGFTCFDFYKNLDNLKVVITTNHKVEETNADIVEGDSYIWEIDKTNSANKSLYLELHKTDYVFNYKNRVTYILLGSVLVAFLIFIVIIVLRRNSKKNNEV